MVVDVLPGERSAMYLGAEQKSSEPKPEGKIKTERLPFLRELFLGLGRRATTFVLVVAQRFPLLERFVQLLRRVRGLGIN